MIRVYIALAVAAVIGGILWHDHHVTKLLNSSRAETKAVSQVLEAERQSRRKDNEAVAQTQARLDDLARQRREQPVAHLVCHPASVPKVQPTGRADEAPQADYPRAGPSDFDTTGFDPSVGLEEFFSDANENLIQCEGLMKRILAQ